MKQLIDAAKIKEIIDIIESRRQNTSITLPAIDTVMTI